MRKRLKIGLALGGGGARGLAHIGVLKVLERERIPIDLIVGTSIGALVGAAYAIRPDAVALERHVLDFFLNPLPQGAGLRRLEKIRPFNPEHLDRWQRIVRTAEKSLFLSLAMLRKAMVPEEEMHRLLECFLPEMDIRDTVIPLAVAAVDLVSGSAVVLKEGPLIGAVMASCAVPGFTPPVAWDDMVLVDGGLIDPVPASAARHGGADRVIGVDVGCCLCQVPPIQDGIDVINRATEIMNFHLNRESGQKADILIGPAVNQFAWTDFLKYQEIIQEGEKAAGARLHEIKAVLNPRFSRKVYLKAIQLIPGIKREGHKGDAPGQPLDQPIHDKGGWETVRKTGA
ncbi:MAG: patatin-like phospholipase family protein [Deltaproteobacteria bacterium]|nr:patatin-like phospholipase family protein [Deltaproteobacteria bacterium]